jgi:hypothetical protein
LVALTINLYYFDIPMKILSMKIKLFLIILCSALLLPACVDTASAFTYSTATKTARLTAVRDQIDGGVAAGKLEIGSAGFATTCATITLNDPSGTVSGDVLTLSGFPKTIAASAICTAAEARIRDSNNADVITGLTVGTSGTNIVIDNTSINAGQNVTINASPSITHAP